MEEKCSGISRAARLAGNGLMKKGNHSNVVIKEIFSHFNRSVAYAELKSQELASAYNNRSVLSHHIKKYDLALSDINEALSINATSTLLKSKLLIRKINCLKSMGDKVEESQIQEVKDLLDKIESSEPREFLSKTLEVKPDREFRFFETNPFPEMTGSKELSCASNAIEIKYDEIFGRQLTVNRYVPPGEVLLVEDAYVVFPNLECRYLYCSHCLNLALTAIPCDSCPCVIFCSESCKLDAWKKYHDVECSIIKRLLVRKEFEESAIILLFRCFILGLKDKDHKFDIKHMINEGKLVENNPDKRTKGFYNGKFISEKFRSLISLQSMKQEDLLTHADIMMQTFLEFFGTVFMSELKMSRDKYNRKFYKSRDWYALKDLMVKIFRISAVNGYFYQGFNYFGISESSEQLDLVDQYTGNGAHGTVIAVCSSLINHHCVPNADRVFKDGKLMIHSVRPIKKGEQIFITYSPYDLTVGKWQRQMYLERSYSFDCDCFACKKDLTMMQYIIDAQRCEVYNFHEKYFKIGNENSEFWLFKFADRLVPFLKSRICAIYQNNTPLDAAFKSYAYQLLLREAYPGLYSSQLNVKGCCKD